MKESTRLPGLQVIEHFDPSQKSKHHTITTQEIPPHVTGAFHYLGSIMQTLKLGLKCHLRNIAPVSLFRRPIIELGRENS